MNVDIVSKTENKLLDRKEVEAEVTFEGATPKKADIKQTLGTKLAANPDLMVIRTISSRFGQGAVRVVAHVYKDKASLEATEPDYIKKREGIQTVKEKKAAAKKAAEEKAQGANPESK